MNPEEFVARGQGAQKAVDEIISGYKRARTKKKYDAAKVKHRRQMARASRKRNRRAA